ncbi:cohesin domain-containing protein [Frigoribacterium salinisoli]
MPHASPRPVPARAAHRLLAAAVLALGLGAVGVAVGAPPASAAPDLPGSPTLVVAPAEVAPGDPVDVTVTLPDVTDAYAVELALDVDPAVLALVEGSAAGPAGGFDTARQDDATITVAHTRLGASPGLEGDVVITVQLLALAPGDGTVALTGATLVGADGVVLAVPAAGLPAADLAVVAPPVVPSPSPTSPAPAPSPTDPAGGATASPGPSPSASIAPAASGSTPTGDLAWTGSELGPVVGIAGAAALLGALALAAGALRHRRLARAHEDGAGE